MDDGSERRKDEMNVAKAGLRDEMDAVSARTVGARTIHVDEDSFVASVGSVDLSLTCLEFDILSYLAKNSHRVVSHAEIARMVMRGFLRYDSSLVRVHVSHLRRKLGADRDAIKTVRERGYRFIGHAPVFRTS